MGKEGRLKTRKKLWLALGQILIEESGRKVHVKNRKELWCAKERISVEIMDRRGNFSELRRGNFSNLFLKHQNIDLHFSHGQFPLLMPKTGKKWKKKTCILRSISHCSLQFYPIPPQNNGLSSLFYHTSLSDFVLTWIIQNFVFNAYANQKLWRKNLWKGSVRPYPLLVSEGLEKTAIKNFNRL